MTATTTLGNNNSHCITINATGNVAFTPVQTAQIPPQKPWFNTQPLGKNNHLSLLRWDRRVCERVGRDAEFEELLAWTDDGDPGIQARLITGDGGTGKSRLAGDLAQELVKRGWRAEKLADRLTEQLVLPLGEFQPREGAGTLAERTPTRQSVAKPAYKGGLLIVVDYPEGRMPLVERLLESLRDYAVQEDIRVRLLMLSRRDSQEWDPVIERARAEGLFQTDAIHLGRSTAPAAQFVTILNGVAKALKQAPPALPAGEPDKWMSNNRAYQQPLFMAAVALHFCLHPEAGLTLGGPEAVTALVRRERTRAENESVGLGWEPDILPRLLALGTLRGGLESAKLNELGQMLGVPAGPDLCDRLRNACDGRIRDNVLVALEPDLPGAAFATLVLSERADQAPDWIWQTIAENPMGLIPRLEQVCHDAEGTLQLLPEGRISQLLVKMIQASPSRASSLGDLVHARQSHRLSELAANVADATIQSGNVNLPEYAQLLNDRSQHIANTGNLAEATVLINQCILTWRKVINQGELSFIGSFSRSLINLCRISYMTGEIEIALKAIEEANNLLEDASKGNNKDYLSEVAKSLTVKAIILSHKDKEKYSDLCLKLNLRSVEIYEKLTECGNSTDLPDLAESLVNLSNRFLDVNNIESALVSNKRAVNIYRKLAELSPSIYLGDLAESLKNESILYQSKEDIDSALRSANESIFIYRKLHIENPRAFGHLLAMSLVALAAIHAFNGRIEYTLEIAKNSLELVRDEATRFPNSPSGRAFSSIQNLINECELSLANSRYT